MSLRYTSFKKLRKERNKTEVETLEDYEKREADLMKRFYQDKDLNIDAKVRIITGKAKGLQIEIPIGSRVLTDRLKTSIFDLLGSDIANKQVLDLYAGSGSFGLEALSRGAKFCTFVDAGRGAESVLIKNIRKTGFLTETGVVRERVERFILAAQKEHLKFDIIFMDPPYKIFNTKNIKNILTIVQDAKYLLPGIKYLDLEVDKRQRYIRFKGALLIKHPRRYPIEKIEVEELERVETFDFGLSAVTLFIVKKK